MLGLLGLLVWVVVVGLGFVLIDVVVIFESVGVFDVLKMNYCVRFFRIFWIVVGELLGIVSVVVV